MNIRRATPEDAPGILSCLAEAFEPFRKEYTADAYRDTILTAELLDARMQEFIVLAAVENDQVVGTIGIDAIGHIRGMAVHPSRHGSGVAQALLLAAETEARGHGCAEITLDTTIYLDRAIAFYERNGYARTGRIQAFKGMEIIEFAKKL